MKVYLAGPDVFHPQARAIAAAKKALCARAGLEALFPLDSVIEADPDEPKPILARKIFLSNRAMIEACAAVLANLTPFRGPSVDPGTAMEIGLAYGLGKRVIGYSNVGETFAARTRAFLRLRADECEVEDFGPLTDNLMIDGAVERIFACDAGPDRLWTDLASFEAALGALSPPRQAFA